jgi:hypothetical protein
MTKSPTSSPTTITNGSLLALLRGLPGGLEAPLMTGWPDYAVELVLTGAIDVLAEHPGATRAEADALGHRLWERVRGLPCGPHNVPLDAQLSQLPLSQAPVFGLRAVIRLLLQAGDLARTLTEQRQTIDRTLERIAAIRGGRR